MTVFHVFYVPAAIAIGVAIGVQLGRRAAYREQALKERAAREREARRQQAGEPAAALPRRLLRSRTRERDVVPGALDTAAGLELGAVEPPAGARSEVDQEAVTLSDCEVGERT